MLPPAVRIYVARDAVDMRKSFDGLAALTQFALGEDPLSGHLYVFRNRTATLLKLLYRDRSGWCLFAKRLERGRFRWPVVREEARSVEIEAGDLACLLDGIDLRTIRRPARWQRGGRADNGKGGSQVSLIT
jgi:transposase